MKASFEKRLAALEGRIIGTREGDLLYAITTWAMSRVFTSSEFAMLIKECEELKEEEDLNLSPEMAARRASAMEVISLELTGRPFMELSSVPRRIREQAIYSL